MNARVTGSDRKTSAITEAVSPTMWFLPRLTPLVVLAILAGLIVSFVLDANIIVVVSGAVFGVLLISVLFDLYEPPKR